MPGGDFGVYNIAPVGGRPTAFLIGRVPTEAEARKITNREGTGQQPGLSLAALLAATARPAPHNRGARQS